MRAVSSLTPKYHSLKHEWRFCVVAHSDPATHGFARTVQVSSWKLVSIYVDVGSGELSCPFVSPVNGEVLKCASSCGLWW